MKKSIIIAGIIGILCFSCDQGKDISELNVPSVVINSLKTEFPDIRDLEWEIITKNYQVEFENGPVDYKALISPNGEIIKYQFEISLSELPEKVKEKIRSEYPNEIAEGAVELQIGTKTFYDVEFEGWLTDDHKIFLPSGEENKNKSHWD